MNAAVTARGVLAAEWIKLRSLRSTVLTVVGAAVALVAVGVVVALVTVGGWASMSPAARADVDVSEFVLSGRVVAQLVLGVLGVVAVTGEYATGSIAATLAAVPRRLPVLWAKVAVLGAVTFVAMLAAALAAFAAGGAIMSAHWEAGLAAPGMARAVAGTAVALAGVAVLGTALGCALRSTAAAVGALFGILMVLPLLGAFVPDVAPYLPSNVIRAFVTVRSQSSTALLAPAPALALFAGYVAVALAAAALVLRGKDA